MNKRISLMAFLPLALISCKEEGTPTTVDTNNYAANAWERAKEIGAAIVVPNFSDQTFNVLDYGVKGFAASSCDIRNLD